jgi:hypothetical protein
MRANIPVVVAAYAGESSRSRGALPVVLSPVLPVIVVTIADARTSCALEIKRPRDAADGIVRG